MGAPGALDVKAGQLRRGKPLGRGKRIKPRSDKKLAALEDEARVRDEVFRRDRVCQLREVAGAGRCFGPLTFHHRRKAAQGGGYTVENGSALCSSHNDRLEAEPELAALARTLGLVVTRRNR